MNERTWTETLSRDSHIPHTVAAGPEDEAAPDAQPVSHLDSGVGVGVEGHIIVGDEAGVGMVLVCAIFA